MEHADNANPDKTVAQKKSPSPLQRAPKSQKSARVARADGQKPGKKSCVSPRPWAARPAAQTRRERNGRKLRRIFERLRVTAAHRYQSDNIYRLRRDTVYRLRRPAKAGHRSAGAHNADISGFADRLPMPGRQAAAAADRNSNAPRPISGRNISVIFPAPFYRPCKTVL